MEKRIFELTVSEFIELLKQQNNNTPLVPAVREKKYVHSIKGMAAELHMSVVTMQKLKNSGRIPYKQDGRKVIFEVSEVLEALSVKMKGQRA
jgi:predicted transcriptional regulator